MGTEILIKGRPIPKYEHEGEIYIEGRKGSEYEIRLTNDLYYNRKSYIVSVDGLCVIDGKPAGVDSPSFVLNGKESIIVKGWLKNNQVANKFEFSKVSKSYSNRVDKGKENVGVIGIMEFIEEPRTVINTVSRSLSNTYVEPYNMICSNIGTGYGNETDFKTHFIGEKTPDDIHIIYYDDRKGLEKRGVVLDPMKNRPNAFPNYYTDNKFCRTPVKK